MFSVECGTTEKREPMPMRKTNTTSRGKKKETINKARPAGQILTKDEREDAPRVIAELEEELWQIILSQPIVVEKTLDNIEESVAAAFRRQLHKKYPPQERKSLKAGRVGMTTKCKKTRVSAKTGHDYLELARKICRIDRDRDLIRAARQEVTRFRAKRAEEKHDKNDEIFGIEKKALDLDRARHCFLRANQGLVAEIAKRYRNRGLPLCDLMQEGNLGLINALNRFDYKKGFKFSTYACWWIQSAIGRAIDVKASTVRIPVSARKTANLLKKTERDIRTKEGRPPTDDDIVQQTGWNRSKLARARRQTSRAMVSLDHTVSSFEGLRYSDMLTDEDARSPFDATMINVWSEDLRKLLQVLSPAERTILRWRFGLSDHHELTLEEIGKRFGLSRERIRQLQEGAIAKLRQQLELDAA
jgi:RNA polymerase sigma factor (sigma-70 family)